MVQIQTRCQWEMLDSCWRNKLGKAFIHIATFRPFQWIPPGASEDIHLPKPLMCQPPAKPDTVQYDAWPILVKHWGWGYTVWCLCLLSKPFSAISILMACLPAVATRKKKMCFEEKRRTGKRAGQHRKDRERDRGGWGKRRNEVAAC